jgi:hypothetical protein
MRRSALLKTSAAIGLFLATGVAVAANPLVVNRGYVSCIDDLERDYPRRAGLVQSRYYYHAGHAEEMIYFVNSTAWQDGDRVRVRTRCLTDRSGHHVTGIETNPGRWIRGEGRITVEEVASR